MTLDQREVLGMCMFKIVTKVGEVKGFVRRTKRTHQPTSHLWC